MFSKKNKAVVTLLTRSHLAYGRMLGNRLKKLDPDLKFYALVADGREDEFRGEPFEALEISRLENQPEIRDMTFYYTPFELCCALRPFLHEYLFKKTRLSQWIFLDSDILQLRSLSPVFKEFEKNSVALTLHMNHARPLSEAGPFERYMLRYGIFNAGFLGVSRGEEAKKFIAWWRERLTVHSFHETEQWLYVDQIWLNFVPGLFPGAKKLTDDGLNVAYWNLHERKVESSCGQWTANGRPLVFFHFSGWKMQEFQKITQNAPVPVVPGAAVLSLSSLYRDELLKNGYQEAAPGKSALETFKDGRPIRPEMRKKFYQLKRAGVWKQGDPFSAGDFFYG